jgi:dynein heavy chain
MVEKWLLQVEDVMISSLRKVIMDANAAYSNTPRNRWVLEWPGQVVICASSIYWTSEVTEAMKEKGGLDVSNILSYLISFVCFIEMRNLH